MTLLMTAKNSPRVPGDNITVPPETLYVSPRENRRRAQITTHCYRLPPKQEMTLAVGSYVLMTRRGETFTLITSCKRHFHYTSTLDEEDAVFHYTRAHG